MSARRVPWTPYVLLGLMTIATVAGPVAIARVIQGGPSPRWPPDRPVEWWTFGLITGLVVVLMAACLWIGLANWQKMPRYTRTHPHQGKTWDSSSS